MRSPLALLILLLVASLLAAQDPAPQPAAAAKKPRAEAPRVEAPPEPRRGVLIRMQGPITSQLEHFIYRSLEKAQSQGAEVVIIEMDSPGGLLDASLKLAHRFEETGWAEVVTYVPREALSGAAIAALGCRQIFLDPRARFGDAGPIFIGEDALFRHAPEKLRSDLAQQVRLLAESHDRPPTLAEAMVDMQLEVFQARNKNTGEVRYLSERELAAVDDPQDWEKGPPVVESGQGRFLEVNGRRAVELGLGDGLVDSREQLFERLGLEPSVRVIEPGTKDGIVYWLNRPLITGLLFVVGLIALYIELSAPGIGIGGLTAGLCFSLFFWSRFLGGTAGWLEPILFLAGLAFLAVELFLIPGFGVAGFAGIALMMLSLVLASQEYLIPHTERELKRSAVSLSVLVGSGFLFLAAAVVISRHFGRLPILNRLALEVPKADAPQDDAYAKPTSSYASPEYRVAVGDWGVTESPLRPAGKVLFGDDYVDVVADGTYIEPGRQVRVIRISGNRIVVREADA